METREEVVIIGAGLAGLSAAYHLEQFGFAPLILEQSEEIGGRVRTESFEGFLLDLGLQVVFPSTIKPFFDLKELELAYFESGVLFRNEGKWNEAVNPFKRPIKALSGKYWKDYLKLFWLYMQGKKSTSIDMQLQEAGFSPSFYEDFLLPLWRGVFLQEMPTAHGHAFWEILRHFLYGRASLPKEGMGALAFGLAKKLQHSRLCLNTKVSTVHPGVIQLSSGEEISTEAIVLAAGGRQAAEMFPSLKAAENYYSTCLYYSIDESDYQPTRYIYLNGGHNAPINHVAFSSAIQPSYAPAGKHLVSVSVVNPYSQKDPELQGKVVKALEQWFAVPASKWNFLKKYTIEDALPNQEKAPTYSHQPFAPIFLCGELSRFATIENALYSGKEVAGDIKAFFSLR